MFSEGIKRDPGMKWVNEHVSIWKQKASVWGHSSSTYGNFFEKLLFRTPWYAQVCFAYLLNEFRTFRACQFIDFINYTEGFCRTLIWTQFRNIHPGWNLSDILLDFKLNHWLVWLFTHHVYTGECLKDRKFLLSFLFNIVF